MYFLKFILYIQIFEKKFSYQAPAKLLSSCLINVAFAEINRLDNFLEGLIKIALILLLLIEDHVLIEAIEFY